MRVLGAKKHEREARAAFYTIEHLVGVMHLRRPQEESLRRLAAAWEKADFRKGADLAANLAAVQALYPTCSDFERQFPSMTFALATGVGKTRLMGAFVTWLYAQKGIKNFFIVAPGMTVYEKLKDNFGNPSSDKYVFSGLLGCFGGETPQVIADDDYRQRRLSFDSEDVRIFIFNIDKFNKEDAAMRSLQEMLGQSFYDELAALDDLVLLMDESHHYRAERGATALNDLKPILGLELTATPKTIKNGKEKLFKNVVYEYPLSAAIRDGYTRTPYALARKNTDPANWSDEVCDKAMLADGLAAHERTKTALEVYAAGDPKTRRRVKPFALVVCKDTDHAKWVFDYVTSDGFCGGAYRNKTIMVHSKLKGAESDENMRLLLDVEKADNPIEIVIHVNMLKEGWDVNNLYTIIPLRTAASAVLREQMVGRGLRLPYGERTGDKAVDAVTLTAHDKFADLIREAQSGESIFKQGCVIAAEDEDADVGEHGVSQPNLDFEEHDAAFDAAVKASLAGDGGRGATALPTGAEANEARRKVEAAIAREAAVAMSERETATLGAVERREVVRKAVESVAKERDVAPWFDPMNHVFDDWTEAKADEITVKTAEKFIPIPRLRITEAGIEELTFEEFDLDFTAFTWQPTDNALVVKNLQDLGEEVQIVEGGKIDLGAYDPARVIIDELRDKPEIDYNFRDHEIVGKLVVATCAFLRKKWGEDGARNVAVMNRLAIAEEIYEQMMKHLRRTNGLFVEKIVGADQTNLPTHFNRIKGKVRNLHDGFDGARDGSIKKFVFTGAKKGVFSEFKVDSYPELSFAAMIDSDPLVANWLRPAERQFDLTYNGHRYEPDFVVETKTHVYLVEIKRHDMVEDEGVKLKRNRAVTYCAAATEWAKANGHKPWTHLFIPDDEITATRTFGDLATGFAVEKEDC